MSQLSPASCGRRAGHAGERFAAEPAVLPRLSPGKLRSGLNMSYYSSSHHRKKLFGFAIVMLSLALLPFAHAGKKKTKTATEPRKADLPEVDTRNLVWPDPPD